VSLAERIRSARKARSKSQEALAYEAGMSLRAFRSLERGEATDPHVSTIYKISEALGVSPYSLLGEGQGGRPRGGTPPRGGLSRSESQRETARWLTRQYDDIAEELTEAADPRRARIEAESMGYAPEDAIEAAEHRASEAVGSARMGINFAREPELEGTPERERLLESIEVMLNAADAAVEAIAEHEERSAALAQRATEVSDKVRQLRRPA
jgi:transcriptional regulator with XRE-family HTH domain